MKRPTRLEYELETENPDETPIKVTINIPEEGVLLQEREANIVMSINQLSQLVDVSKELDNIMRATAFVAPSAPLQGTTTINDDEKDFFDPNSWPLPPKEDLSHLSTDARNKLNFARSSVDMTHNLFIVGKNGTYLDKSKYALTAGLRETFLLQDPSEAQAIANRLNAEVYPYHAVGGYKIGVISPSGTMLYWIRNGLALSSDSGAAQTYYGRGNAEGMLAAAEVPANHEKVLVPATS